MHHGAYRPCCLSAWWLQTELHQFAEIAADACEQLPRVGLSDMLAAFKQERSPAPPLDPEKHAAALAKTRAAFAADDSYLVALAADTPDQAFISLVLERERRRIAERTQRR